MNGLPQNILLNFRLEFPKSDLTIYLVWGPSEPQRCRQPPTLSLYYVGKMKETIFSETLCANKGQQQLAIEFYFPFLTNFQT